VGGTVSQRTRAGAWILTLNAVIRSHRAQGHHEAALKQLGGDFASITYYGDGEWDAAATRSLGWQFIPVGEKLDGLTRFTSETEPP
jgi:hypothetical protein